MVENNPREAKSPMMYRWTGGGEKGERRGMVCMCIWNGVYVLIL